MTSYRRGSLRHLVLPPPRAEGAADGPLAAVVPLSVPAGARTFVGRDRDLAAAVELLADGRLVTLTGEGGMGKSRLAVWVASSVVDDFPDGVRLVELGPATEPGRSLASVLGVGEAPGWRLEDVVAARLRAARMLLVLDDCEHVVAGCARLVERLLGSCPWLHVLATSREPLAHPGDRVWRVGPLSVPAAGEADVARLFATEAVRLFVERATVARPGFGLSPEVAVDVATICRRLDGNPLAVELAAARLDVLTPAQIAAGLDDRFRLLVTPARGGRPCHRSLAAALEWSHQLLSGEEAVLFRRLAVFAGGFALPAVEEVAVATAVERERVPALVDGLVAKSLVVAGPSGADTRYHLLESVQHYGRDRLAEAGELSDVRARHAAWCLGLAERAERDLGRSGRGRWRPQMATEDENFEAALEWALSGGDAVLGARLASALHGHWRRRGRLREGLSWCRRAMAATDDAPAPVRARLLASAGALAVPRGDLPFADRVLGESLRLFRSLDDAEGVGWALSLLGRCRMDAGDPTALAAAEESVAVLARVADPRLSADALHVCGELRLVRGDMDAARGHFVHALALAWHSRNQLAIGSSLVSVARVALMEGDWAQAGASLEKARAIAEELDDRCALATIVHVQARLARSRGDFAAAATLGHRSLDLARAVGVDAWLARSLAEAAKVSLAEDDLRVAQRQAEEALAVARSVGTPYVLARSLLTLGEVLLAGDDPSGAGTLFEEALSRARTTEDRHAVADGLDQLGHLARVRGTGPRARVLHRRALSLRAAIGDLPGVADSLDALAGVTAAPGRHQRAARLFAAADAIREARGRVRTAAARRAREADVASVRRALTAERFARAWAQGAAASVDEALALADVERDPGGPTAAP